jgi:hypothetical protein
MKCLALSLLLVATAAVADIGSITEVTGTAIIKRGSTSVTVSKGTAVEMNDRVEAKNGEVKITFKDDTTVRVTASSALVIDDFVYDPKTKGGKLGLRAAEGTVRYVSGNIAHNNPNSVNIKTPTAAIAVRGTDFVMAVDETGKSLVMLMPTCEENTQVVNLKGLVCGSGKIDVDSGGLIVHLDKPYQATMVETAGQAPTPAMIVNLSNTTIGNNLIIRPPQTIIGLSVQQAARTAAQKTGDVKKEDSAKADPNGPSIAEANTTQQQDRQHMSDKERQQADADAAVNEATQKLLDLQKKGVVVKANASEDEHIIKIYKNDNPNLNQTGWGWVGLSASGLNYAGISVANDSKILLTVTQDRVIDAYNFNGFNTRPQGSITIVQTYK